MRDWSAFLAMPMVVNTKIGIDVIICGVMGALSFSQTCTCTKKEKTDEVDRGGVCEKVHHYKCLLDL